VNAGAQGPANQDTYFTFSQPVELPKTTLPAGTYFFQLMDSPSNRHIVKVMSQDRTKLHATLMAIPYYSTDRPSDDPQVRFLEVPAANGAAASNAIKIWFYPGNTVGHEFIWPRDKAMSLARATSQTVLTTKTEAEDSELTRVDASGVDAAVSANATESSQQTAETQTTTQQVETQTAERTETQPAPATTEVAQAEVTTQREPVGAISGTDAAPAPMPERTEDAAPAPRTDLPNTAGVLPLLALMGLGSLAGSRLMRRARQ